MKLLRNLNKSLIILLILSFALGTFLAGLFAVIKFQSKFLSSEKIETAVIEAERLVTFDRSITLERALKLYSNNLSFAVFDQNCNPVYVTDLLIHSKMCVNRHENFTWEEITSPTEKKLIIGFSTKFDLTNYLSEYRPILLSTIGTYLIFILILTFLFFRLFIENPIKKISDAINSLLQTKQFNIDTFKGSNKNLLSSLYDAVSKLILEVVRFNREEEKLILSRQIAHDLRAPLSILEEQFKAIANPNSLERLALKRLRDISDSLMPQAKHSAPRSTNIKSLIGECVQIYPQISFKFNLSEIENENMHLVITEIELFRFLLNVIKNSTEANAKSIEIKANISDNIFEITLKDDGEGTNQENVAKIMEGFTSKPDGHGLGVSAIFSQLKAIGGELIIHSSVHNGFSTTMRIPIHPPKKMSYILIDDDRLIRIGWDSKAKKNGIELKCYESIDLFINDHVHDSLEAHIYIDSNLKNEIRGEVDSERLATMGYLNLFLSTGFSESDFNLSAYPWIKGVVSKTPPF